ncbi:MAG: DUF1295 domain-containing protein [Bacteroidales bacterium]|jgi:3-oxo-5-alpha-steroid 4-dehydrogenase 1|nr:DUF1295 domain-containing protein [Bacteroidales bacterium]MCI2121233.1 DUF1295 domain-containing protein [Bacteroidales bacterium]MCI2145977.1 DUF1295 domain-containing protein [Bacteroidales bacterium]
MTVLAVIVFVALQYYNAGYGYLHTRKWGISVSNKIGWIIMEAPVFFLMWIMLMHAERSVTVTIWTITFIFEMHYFQRSFIFPLLIRGKSTMPVAIIIMGMVFNSINAYMQGGWLYHYCPPDMYSDAWLHSPKFIIGTLVFLFGFYTNLQSDYIIRHLRKDGDPSHKHYIPYGGMFKYVSSANYFGEITEWVGFALLSWSPSGLVFALWTIANLVPRSNSLYNKYNEEFGEEFSKLNRKRVIPFIY